jgi:hypothetical protein
MHIVLGGNYPTWLKEGQLVKVLATLPWVQTVSNFKQGTANGGLALVDRFTIHIKPRIGQTVKDVVLNGNNCHDGVSVEELMGSERISFTLDINGIDVTFRRAPCCGFCGWDSHIQLDCEYLQRFTSDVGPVFRARSLQGKDVKEAIVETHLNKLFFS